MEVYLDNSATSKVSQKVMELVTKLSIEDYGNPSSKHNIGMKAEQYIKKASEIIGDSLKVQPKEIIFTSGGTEANNLALIGTAFANNRSGKHIITTRIEHPSVHEPMVFLESCGFKTDFAPVDRTGKVVKEKLYEMIKDDTILISIMYVNNEIGSVQDIEELITGIRKRKSNVIIHVDGTQAIGKYHIYPERQGIDLLTFSGHKIHGPKGIGALYAHRRVKINPILLGGGQQRGYRSGTENVPAIAGLGLAVEESYENFHHTRENLYKLKQHFLREVSAIDDVKVNGLPRQSENFEMEYIKTTAPHIISVSFKGIKSEVLLHALEDKGIYVSSGSACRSNSLESSTTLAAIGLSEEEMDSTLRFSMSKWTTKEEIDYTIEQLKEIVPFLRRYTRR